MDGSRRIEVHRLATVNRKTNSELLPPSPEEDSQCVKLLRRTCNKIVDNPFVQACLAIMTIWALFGPDIEYSTPKSSTVVFQGIIWTIFFVFSAEIFMSMLAKPEYFPALPVFARLPGEKLQQTFARCTNIGSFYFYLDWIATLSLLFEMDLVIGSSDVTTEGRVNQTSALEAGARAGRLIRLVRMVRLFRLVKLYKYAVLLFHSWQVQVKEMQRRKAAVDNKYAVAQKVDEDEEDKPAALGESQLGQRMADLTSRRVIILILLLLIVVPQLQGSPSDMSVIIAANFIQVAAGAAVMNTNASMTTAYAQAFYLAVNETMRILPVMKLSLHIDGNIITLPGVDPSLSSFMRPELSTLRNDEIRYFDTEANPALGGVQTLLIISNKQNQVATSILSIGLTVFIISLLMIGTFSFNSAIGKLVIGPIEKMVALVHEISLDPLGANYKDMSEEDGFMAGMETTTLLITINKIGSLMRVGFGEAGASVIANCLGTSGRLNLIADGRMISSIFGFCDVRQFTDTTECLQEEVMLFVNRIAHILHSIVVQCSGSANKNIGDAFLLTWKLDGLTTEQSTSLADQALMCFCKALIELARYQTFICNFTPAATQRLFRRFPGYVVRIGSGLHVGWAVEGAIGSNRKIDASYLSPHVNFTEFLESSTKAYGVPLLISEPFVKMLSPTALRYIRQVDRIKKPGMVDPIGIYTYDSDIWINWAEIDEAKETQRLRHTKRQQSLLAAKDARDKGKKNMSLFGSSSGTSGGAQSAVEKKEPTARKALKGAPDIIVFPYSTDVWDDDEDLIQLRHHVDGKFREIWRGGIEAYISGDWEKVTTFKHTTCSSIPTYTCSSIPTYTCSSIPTFNILFI